MNIVAVYQEVGTYRGAAEICGTTHKTVKPQHPHPLATSA